MNRNNRFLDETWGRKTFLPASLEHLEKLDSNFEDCPRTNCLMSKLIKESLSIERKIEIDRSLLDVELDELNNISSDEDLEELTEKNKEIIVMSDLLNSGCKSKEIAHIEIECRVQSAVSSDSIDLKTKITALTARIKDSSIDELFISNLKNLSSADLDYILLHTWEGLPDENLILLVEFLSQIEYDPFKFWNNLILNWFFKHSDLTFCFELVKSARLNFLEGYGEGIVLPSLKNIQEESDGFTEVIKNLFELLSSGERTLILKQFLNYFIKDFEIRQFNILYHLIELTELDDEINEVIINLLQMKILDLKNNRQMGLLILAVISKIPSGHSIPQRLTEICSKYVGTLRFRIAQTLKKRDGNKL